MTNMKKTSLAALCIAALSGCASTSDENGERDQHRGLKTGAAGGALIGLAMGAVMGDASLAAKGAMFGAATGAAAGAAADYHNDREDYRNENSTKNININGLASAPMATGAASMVPQSWDKLDSFNGNWRVDIWALDAQGSRIEASGMARGSLTKTTAVELHFDALQVNGEPHSLSGRVQLAYTPSDGYSLETDFSNNELMRFSGELNVTNQRYSYYPVNVQGQTLNGDERNSMRLELRFAGKDVFLVDTFTQVKGEEQLIQSYRFTRQG